MKASKEIRSAILVLSGIFLFIFIFNYLKGENLFSRSIKIISVYENVEGLSESSSVTINGHTVGKVQDINFSNDGSGNLEVVMLIDTDLKFSRNSYAELYESGLIGGKAIAIVPVKDNAPHAKTGDILSSRTKPGLTDLVNQRLTPLQEKIESVMVSADKLLINLNNVFDDKTKINLKNKRKTSSGHVQSRDCKTSKFPLFEKLKLPNEIVPLLLKVFGSRKTSALDNGSLFKYLNSTN